MTDAKTIRAWARENRDDCPTTGLLPKRITDAYYDAHPDESRELLTVVEPVGEADGDEFTLSLTIAGHAEAAAEIEQYLVNALWAAAFQAGRTAARLDILAALDGTP
jgi:hypothetical protein